MRLACLHIPLFPLAARLRSEPELRDEAIAIVDGSGNAARVQSASKRARKFGIRPGLSLAQARAILPSLVARGRDEECERAAQEALLDLAESFSPRVEDAGEGVVYVDLDGLSRLYQKTEVSTPSWEHDFAQRVLLALDASGLPAWIGIGSSKLAARIAAELPDSPTIIPAGEEMSFLAPLPLARLTPEIEIADRLDRWGIRSIGEFARLPERDIASRLGETGRALHHAAKGTDPRPLIPRVPPPDFREGMDLEWPLVAIEPFLFIANAALDRLTQRLAVHGLACRRLELRMKLEPDGFHDRALDLPAPTREVKTLLTLTRLDLESHPPGAPVIGFVFIAHPDQPRTAQLSLYGPLALSPDKLATTIARLAALVGADRVGTPAAVDSHRPERFELEAYDPPSPPKIRREAVRHRGLLAVRVLRPAVDLEVRTSRAQEPEGGPGLPEGGAGLRARPRPIARQSKPLASLASDEQGRPSLHGLAPDPCTARSPTHIRAIEPDDTLRIDGAIRIASGPWRMEEGWWSDSPENREYWDVELERGGVYRIYQDQRGKWFADGVYD